LAIELHLHLIQIDKRRIWMKRLMALPVALLYILAIVSAVACGSSSPKEEITYCAAGCQTSWIGDGTCDSACDNAACDYDEGDCDLCASGCEDSYLNDGHCDTVCNNYPCNHDGGDCTIPISPDTGYSCPCGDISYEWDAEDCVWSYLLSDAATTDDGRKVQAAVADAFESGALRGTCLQSADGSWTVNTYFDTWAIEDEPLLGYIFTQTSICGPSNREAYNTAWSITSEGCVQGIDGNAMRLLTELQN